jgi:protein TonB
MTETHTSFENPKQSLSWPRIAGTSFAIALHVVVFMTLMAPVTSPQSADKTKATGQPSSRHHPTTPPPPLPEPPKTITKIIETPKRLTCRHHEPAALQRSEAGRCLAPPPAPPAPPALPADFAGTVDPTGRALNPPKYPAEEQRQASPARPYYSQL